MNAAIENMLSRRSCREFDPNKAVPEDVLKEIIEAGLHAPSGKNNQSGIIIAITNKELIAKLSALNCQIGGWKEGFDPFYGAPCVLIVLTSKEANTHVYDGALMMENLMLAASSHGLGSCWIHRAKQEFEMPEGQAILKDLGIEGEYEGIGHCVIGYAKGTPVPEKKIRENRVFFIR